MSNFRLINDSVAIYDGSKIPPEEELNKALFKLTDILTGGSKGVAKDLMIFRKYVPILLAYHYLLADVNKANWDINEQLMGKTAENNNKRWSKEEDEQLIDMVCKDFSMIQIATELNRTPAAISTRVSMLVGIQKLSKEIAGKFIGTLNGAKIEGTIKGELRK